MRKVCAPLLLAALTLTGCPADRTEITLEPAGWIECVQLDREPLTNPDPACVDLDTSTQPERSGTLHQDIDRPLAADIVPSNIPAERRDRLPVSDCFWTAGSDLGGADRVALHWEMILQVQWEDDPPVLRSACRFDHPVDRISLSEADRLEDDPDRNVWRGCVNMAQWVPSEDLPPDRPIKTRCDAALQEVELREHPLQPLPFGQCSARAGSTYSVIPTGVNRSLTGYGDPGPDLFGCTPADGPNRTTLVPRVDATFRLFSQGFVGSIDQELRPALMHVSNERTIARPLAGGALVRSWSTPIVAGDQPGNQRWLENFSPNVRVSLARVFHTEQGSPQHIDMEGSTLCLRERAHPNQQADCVATCVGTGNAFDLASCSIDATPTYRLAALNTACPSARASECALPAPLIWEVQLANHVSAPTEGLYLEFELASVYRTRQSAIQLDPAVYDFPDTPQHGSSETLLTVESVGYGDFIVESIQIDPAYGHAHAFSASAVKGHTMIPHPVYLESQGGSDYLLDVDVQQLDTPLLDIREFETHLSVAHANLHGLEMAIEGEGVSFVGRAGVSFSDKPRFNGALSVANRRYPLRYPVHHRWSLPDRLAPAQRGGVILSFRPPFAGEFKGRLNVTGYPAHDPGNRTTASVFVNGYGSLGAVAQVIPGRVDFVATGAAAVRQIVVVNAGDAPLGVGDISIIDTDSQLHAGESQYFQLGNAPSGASVAVGDSLMATVEYDPGCYSVLPVGQRHRAAVEVQTDDGTFLVAVSGDPDDYAQRSESCGINP